MTRAWLAVVCLVTGGAVAEGVLACSSDPGGTAPADAAETADGNAPSSDRDAAGGGASDSSGGGDGGSDAPAPHAIDIGMCGWLTELPYLQAFRLASKAPPSEPRLCHVYTYWNITQEDPPGANRSHTMSGLIQWFTAAASACDEPMVTFQGRQSAPEAPPTAAQFEAAFVAFQRLTDPGQPLAAWNGKLSYTAWNEPNNKNPSGSGLTATLSPEQAADYYLAARKHCDPAAGCKVAAGDFATNGNLGLDLALNCADDDDPANTPARCASPSSFNPGNAAAPSYADRYKNRIANHAIDFGLPATFRPEYLAYHPWHDVNSYIVSDAPCTSYQDCATRRLLAGLGGAWAGTEIWDNEIGVGLQTNPPPDASTTQPCGAAFLMQLTKLSPRIRRIYYMWIGSGNGPLYDGATIRPAGEVLAERATTYAAAKCAPTGM